MLYKSDSRKARELMSQDPAVFADVSFSPPSLLRVNPSSVP